MNGTIAVKNTMNSTKSIALIAMTNETAANGTRITRATRDVSGLIGGSVTGTEIGTVTVSIVAVETGIGTMSDAVNVNETGNVIVIEIENETVTETETVKGIVTEIEIEEIAIIAEVLGIRIKSPSPVMHTVAVQRMRRAHTISIRAAVAIMRHCLRSIVPLRQRIIRIRCRKCGL